MDNLKSLKDDNRKKNRIWSERGLRKSLKNERRLCRFCGFAKGRRSKGVEMNLDPSLPQC